MKTKTCPTCKQEKPLEEFNSQGRYCRLCHNERNRQWRENNREKYRESQRKYEKKRLKTDAYRRAQRRGSRKHYKNNRGRYVARAIRYNVERLKEIHKLVLDYLEDHHCVDCGESDPVKLQFDHVRGEKEFNISSASSRYICSIPRIKKEILKCDVRCANCHAVKTARENNYWTYRLTRNKGDTDGTI